MSHTSRASELNQLREALLQHNSELFLTITERRALCLKIQGIKENTGRYSSYDPEREKEVFANFQNELKELSLKELLAFSLIMEDQAQAFAPGSYPSWSQGVHLENSAHDVMSMINPLLLKFRSPELFAKLKLNSEFAFLSL